MSEDNTRDSADLFPGEDSESTEENSEASTTPEGEESTNGESAAEQQKARQIAVWHTRVESGEVGLDDVPHPWLRKEVEQRMAPKTPDTKELVAEEVQKELARREAENRFNALKSQLGDLKLDKAQREAVTAEFDKLVSHGVPKDVALDTAIKSGAGGGVDDLFKAQEMRGMALPQASYYKPVGTEPDLNNLSTEEYLNASDDEIIKASQARLGHAYGPPKV